MPVQYGYAALPAYGAVVFERGEPQAVVSRHLTESDARAECDRLNLRPKIVSLAMTSRCNLRCVMCDHGVWKVEKQDFEESAFGNIGDFIDTATMIDLTGLGEPLLSDLFWKILKSYPADASTRDDEFVITFNTNGTLLSDSNIDRILAARVSKIRVSIDAADEATFFNIRGTSLKHVVDGTRHLIEKRNALGRFRPRIGIVMTLMRETLGTFKDMIDLCAEIGADYLEVWSLNALPEAWAASRIVEKEGWTFSYPDQSLAPVPADELADKLAEWNDYSAARGIAMALIVNGSGSYSGDFDGAAGTVSVSYAYQPRWTKNSIRCPLPWNEVRVLYEGDVHSCCWHPGSIGNVTTDTLETIWAGKALRELRSDLVDGRIPKLCSGAPCPYVNGQMRPADPTPAPPPFIVEPIPPPPPPARPLEKLWHSLASVLP